LHGIGALFTGGVFNQGLGALRLLIFAPLLGPAHFGALRLAMTASAILSSMAGLGVYTSYLRFLPEAKDSGQSSGFIKKTLLISLISSLAGFLILLLIRNGFTDLLFSDSGYLPLAVLVSISLPVTVVYKSFSGVASGSGHFKISAIGDAIQNFIYLLMGIVVLAAISRTSQSAFLTYLIGLAVGAGWIFNKTGISAHLKRVETGATQNTLFRRAIQYSIWYSLIPLFHYLFNFIDRWMLAHFYNLEKTGVYSIVPVLAGGMFVVGGAFSRVIARKGSELKSKNLTAAMEKLVWSTIVLSVLCSHIYSLIIRLLEPFIWRIAGSEWQAALPLLPLFLVYFTFFNSFNLIGCFASFEEKTWVHLISVCAGAVVNILMNLALIKPYGIYGAAIGTFTGILVTIVVHIIFINQIRIAIPSRIWLAFAISFSAFLPRWVFVFFTILLFISAIKSNILLSDSDRRMIRAWIGRTIRGWKRSKQ